MALHDHFYKEDISYADEEGQEVIRQKKRVLAAALDDYFGPEVTLDDVMSLAKALSKAHENEDYDKWEKISHGIRGQVENLV